ncbi:MAG TPA: SRPBCC family protein, partial [Chloroflexota bacterium]
AGYELVTVWQVRAPIDQVWDAIYHSERWPEWWPGVVGVRSLQPPDEQGLGGLTRYVWKSALPYSLIIDTSATRIERPHTVDGRSTGELEGEGRWRLSEADGITTVRYEWDVVTTKAWMNLLAPLLRPAFQWNHDVVMRQGGDGLRRLLETPAPRQAAFDADRLAYLETAIWRAYYDRRWFRVLGLTLQLVHEQFGLSWPRAIQASYYTTRAAVAWAPADHNVERVRHYLRHFYRTVRRADADHIGDRELDYWILHRDLSGRPQSRKEPLERSLADLHAALFGLPREATAESGVARARAADAVDETTSGRAQDVAGDWARVERHLRDCYRSISRQLE